MTTSSPSFLAAFFFFAAAGFFSLPSVVARWSPSSSSARLNPSANAPPLTPREDFRPPGARSSAAAPPAAAALASFSRHSLSRRTRIFLAALRSARRPSRRPLVLLAAAPQPLPAAAPPRELQPLGLRHRPVEHHHGPDAVVQQPHEPEEEDTHVRPVRERPARLRVAARLGDLREPDRGVDRQGLPGQGLDGQPVARGKEQAPQVLDTHGPTVYRGPLADDQKHGSRSPPIRDAPERADILNLTMSCVPVLNDGDELCANCGKQGSDTIKLKSCTACRLVKYCGVDCQRADRKQHKKACKQRAAERKDEQLYSQGHERPEGDFCPICTLPIPLPMDKHSGFNACCMKRICHGCTVAAQKRGLLDCAFCRTAILDNNADNLAMIQARVAKKDPEAINFLGEKFVSGQFGLHKDMQRAVKLLTEAAGLGSIKALFNLSVAYDHGEGVQQDKVKAVEFYKKAAMQGSVEARHNLGCIETRKGNHDRAVRHFLISAKMGSKDSLEAIKKMFMAGLATNEQYVKALKGHQEALEEMKSHDRDEAQRLRDEWGLNL
ncbi:hypothetical protein THAOC_07209 [Thalassiosira oceanica]|uniref:MYND-type domain-containing protein n=1 Tax=Thalassiosira oceanica TaxID=159749 RepID=K0T2H0_THAOC|nr:hypothetical protein THAOC_07209 [Thalassiosira oceanica]|eukprot:EJK71364.1 hypothetical protein THAOC_07209 [Thalassiosira oceanica]